MKEEINVVWLKRDLRTQDHSPLQQAEKSDLPYLIIYLFEPSILKHPDSSDRHLQFVYFSILAMNDILKPYQQKVHVLYGEATEVFKDLSERFHLQNVYSYQESGTQITFDRDLQIKKFFRNNAVNWREYQRDGIVRGIKNRNGWDKDWYQTISKPVIKNQYEIRRSISYDHPFTLPDKLIERIKKYSENFQPAGEVNAWKYINTFVNQRGLNYNNHISKPLDSRTSCSRFSPFLAWGNISIKQVYQFVKQHDNYPKHKRAFSAFQMRLKWHCHFIQKFEMECDYETKCVNRGYELLTHANDDELLNAWKSGRTGYPLVDACMRCVKETGWLNFRMRAMIVSFLCHHLDQDWRRGAYHLAQLFLDYEPGIHYPQFQMQAGTTGINTIRIYNPIKQSKDHDPEGKFIKMWIQELSDVHPSLIHEPWKMTELEQNMAGIKLGQDYPLPIVDIEKTGKSARDKTWNHRKHPLVKEEIDRILGIHTRRKSDRD